MEHPAVTSCWLCCLYEQLRLPSTPQASTAVHLQSEVLGLAACLRSRAIQWNTAQPRSYRHAVCTLTRVDR